MKKNWRYWWTFLYFVVYLVCFFFIEHFIPVTQYHMISTPIDHIIPFNEWFVFFYISWFGYIFFSFWYFFFKDKKEYLQMITFLFTGMTLFIVVSVIYPNGLDIRPKHLGHTPTNVLPSIHIFNSIGMCMAFSKSKHATSIMKKGTIILTIGIIISTFLTKQHGIIDALSAVVLSIIFYVIVYKKNIYLLKRKS